MSDKPIPVKPWEETWVFTESHDGEGFLNCGDHGTIAEFFGDYPQPIIGRGKLAAQAPAMARLLFEVGHRLRRDDAYEEFTERAWRLLRDSGVIP